ncbi:MAG: Ig-like domain-containing protein [Acidobacteriia bacterium]|jgi:uncharacterized protein YjdB|nr:Ig-like domain-containing protein [Terriglobia bacterium]
MLTGRKLVLTLAFGILVAVALGVGCRGFFVNQPTSVTITPASPTFTSGQQQAFTALAAFSDNTSKDVTAKATWTTSNSCIVAIIASGANAGHATDVGSGGSATITASYNGVSGTATASVDTGLTITPCPMQVVGNYPEVVFNVGQSATFTASGASGTVTWTSNNTSAVNFASSSSGTATFPSAGTATITATASTNTGTLFITVQ